MNSLYLGMLVDSNPLFLLIYKKTELFKNIMHCATKLISLHNLAKYALIFT